MVEQINRLSDKKPREKIKGQEKILQEQRRPVLEKEKKIDFYSQWKPQQGVREEEEEGEDYLSEGEEGRLSSGENKETPNPTGREKETGKEGEEEELGGEETVETQEYRDGETAGLIREYQKNAKLTQETH